MSAPVPRWKVALRLGRVSNLPTVWTNVAAGVSLSGARLSPGTLALVAASMSLFYTGGMFLNDAFDRDIDARERPERPIPAGLVGARSVFAAGFGQLAAGEALIALAACTRSGAGGAVSGTAILAPLAGGAALASAIVLYDLWHKKNPLSPVLMGLCRAIVYVTAALVASGTLPGALPIFPAAWADLLRPGPIAFVAPGAIVAWCYLIGLTYAAKQESLDRMGRLWPLVFLAVPFVFGAPALLRDPAATAAIAGLLAVVAYAIRLLRGTAPNRFPRAVMALIAGISLLDAIFVARAGGSTAAVLCTAAGFPATLWMQRWVRGT